MTKKFRVWSKSKNRFLSGILITEDGLVCHIEKYEEFSLPKNQDDFTIQQWTGLTDSQGVEIYEGDIVFTIYPEYKIAKVFFCANSASFRLLSGNVALPMVTMRTQEKQSPKLINVFEKVIGNIFQNPELLEKSWNLARILTANR